MQRVRKNNILVRRVIWRIAIYIRLSREESEESKRIKGKGSKGSKNVLLDSSSSVVEQEKILTEWVQARFAEEDYVIVGYFIEIITTSLIQFHFWVHCPNYEKPPINKSF